MGGKVGVLVEVNCETDFVARTDDFQTLVKELALHIAAADPKFARREDVPAELLEKEKENLPRAVCRLGQAGQRRREDRRGQAGLVLLADRAGRSAERARPNVTISQLIAQASAKTGENITVGRFARFKIGELARPRFDRFRVRFTIPGAGR